MRDLMNQITPKVAIVPAVVSNNTAQVGEIIDTLGYDSLTFVIGTGTLADADATFTVLVEEGDDSGLSDAAAVDDADLIGTEALASFDQDADDSAFKIGYNGNKRYVRLTLTPAGNGAAAPLSALAILGHPQDAPTSNPPV